MERLNTPSDEIRWLKRNQLTHGELDDFPEVAIVLHRVDIERYLKELGFDGYYKSFSYGFTDAVLVFVVRKPGVTPFAVARGLPGAGGITTEAAELHAMGINTIIHVGTAGLLSPGIPYGQLIVSDGSYKDGAAFLLENEPKEQISRPDQSLTEKIVETVNKDNVRHIRAIGFTMPIYYFQPGSMLRTLLGVTGPDKPMFIEMEEASLFALARLAGFRAASIVVASDRLESHDGRLSQEFWEGDLDQLERLAFQEAVNTIAGPIQH
jgi:purine-nucleoside phosphorylase